MTTRLRRRAIGRAVIATFAALYLGTAAWHGVKPMPDGTAVDSGEVALPQESVEFLHDLTYRDAAGATVREQQVFDAVFAMIDAAQSFVVLDFFLFNDQAGNAAASPRPLSRELADRLLARRQAVPGIRILVVTDPINDVYGGAPSPLLAELAAAGIDVVRTDLSRLRDPNPGYSALWRVAVQWFGNSPALSWLPNPFGEGPSRISLRSWLMLLNFKANHRKVIVADGADGRDTAIITSGNPHDASSGHSNVAWRITGAPADAIRDSEIGVARFSGWSGSDLPAGVTTPAADSPLRATYLTEGPIRDRLLERMSRAGRGDDIAIAMFYLSDRRVVRALLEAAERGARVRLILDPNKDAFGIEKDGVPNRPVARELVAAGRGIEVRWYGTNGEQFHTKLAIVTQGDRVSMSLGSANLTRRNLGNYNLEANLEVDAPRAAPLAVEVLGYFDRLWHNEAGIRYTLPYEAYQDDSRLRYWRYRLMESTGLSTF